MNETLNPLDPYHFYFELPLYTKIEITEELQKDFENLITFQGELNAFNPILGENTTYSLQGVVGMSNKENSISFLSTRHGNPMGKSYVKSIEDFFTENNGYKTTPTFYAELKCKRESKSYYAYMDYDKSKKILQKIGQYPSIASFHIAKVKDYSKVLSKEKMKELTRAIGLAANGVGVGSFVYLRRIFEHLLEEAHQEAMKDANWEEEKYKNERVKEKILMLEKHLPTFLIENIALYSILSKGIHELEENECLAHFEVVRIGIELILDEKLNEYERKKKQEEAAKKISVIAGKLNNK